MKAQLLFEFLVILAIAISFSLLVLSVSLAYKIHLSGESNKMSNSIAKAAEVLNSTLPNGSNLRVIV